MKRFMSLDAQINMQDVRLVDNGDGNSRLVVPVIALVEGVLWGVGADGPELALASAFGDYPAGWNGRPVTDSHPMKVFEFGENRFEMPVSANSPEVLEKYKFGEIFNTKLEDKKLKMEAWIDMEKVDSSDDKDNGIRETISRIQKGDITEVSVGVFVDLDERDGIYNGEQYSGVWRDVVPDHLAFLRSDEIGACSVDDGCGAGRYNFKTLSTIPEEQIGSNSAGMRIPVNHAKDEDEACCEACENDMKCNCSNNKEADNMSVKSDDELKSLNLVDGDAPKVNSEGSKQEFDDDILKSIATNKEAMEKILSFSNSETDEADESEESDDSGENPDESSDSVDSGDSDESSAFLDKMPVEFREFLQEEVKSRQNHKNSLIERILEHKSNKLPREVVENLDISALSNIWEMVEPDEALSANSINYSGNGAASSKPETKSKYAPKPMSLLEAYKKFDSKEAE